MGARAWRSDVEATIMMAGRAVKTESFPAHTHAKLTGTGTVAATALWRHGGNGRAKEDASNGQVDKGDQREHQRGSVQERARNPKVPKAEEKWRLKTLKGSNPLIQPKVSRIRVQ